MNRNGRGSGPGHELLTVLMDEGVEKRAMQDHNHCILPLQHPLQSPQSVETIRVTQMAEY